jgi:predicted RNA-binding Zn-ribbon protein involved in translation (DUF1610 family)
MSKVTEVSDEQLKAMITGNYQNVAKESTPDVPTEVIELPSKGMFYPEGHPLASGRIEMKYMTAKEEDILTSQNLIKQGVVIDKLLQALIVDKFNYNDLLVIDKNALFIAARVLGYGKDYEVEVACPACGEKSRHTVDLTSFESKDVDFSAFTKGQNAFNFTLPASKKVLTLKFLTHGDEKRIEEEMKGLKKMSSLTKVDPELTTRLKHIITAVDGNPDAVTTTFVNSLLAVDSLALRKFLKEITPDIDTTFNYTCPHCGHENERIPLPIDVSFFWPGV